MKIIKISFFVVDGGMMMGMGATIDHVSYRVKSVKE